MNKQTPMNHRPTEELVALNAAHHIQPFANGAVTKTTDSRVVTRAEGVYLYDSEGHRILDGMAGLWCVNIGMGGTNWQMWPSARCSSFPIIIRSFKRHTRLWLNWQPRLQS